MPLASILIPTYNQAEYLAEAIQSALDQDYGDLEIIVSDDASTDATEELTQRFQLYPRLSIKRNTTNLGRVGNYRKCLYELASGEWVLMLDGDDYLCDQSYISKAIEATSLESDIDLVFANAARLREDLNGQIQPPHENHGLPDIIEGCELFLLLASKKISLFHNTCLYKRHKAIDMDFYRNNIISSDWESLHRYILTGKVAYLDEVAAVWRLHGRNATRIISAQERFENLQAIIGPYQHAKMIRRFPLPVIESWYKESLSQAAAKDARTLLKARDFPGYRNYFRYLKSVHPAVYRSIGRSPALLARRLRARLSLKNC
jgi:glycosyltransferase involved in cell wall biosynthesis